MGSGQHFKRLPASGLRGRSDGSSLGLGGRKKAGNRDLASAYTKGRRLRRRSWAWETSPGRKGVEEPGGGHFQKKEHPEPLGGPIRGQ